MADGDYGDYSTMDWTGGGGDYSSFEPYLGYSGDYLMGTTYSDPYYGFDNLADVGNLAGGPSMEGGATGSSLLGDYLGTLGSTGGGSDLLSSLLKGGLGALTSLLTKPSTSSPTSRGVSSSNPVVNKALQDESLGYLSPYIASLLGQLSNTGFTAGMSGQLADAMNLISTTKPQKTAAATSLLNLINEPPGLSKYSLQAGELAQQMAAPRPEDIQKILKGITPQMAGMNQEQINTLVNDYMVKSKTSAQTALESLGKQEEQLKLGYATIAPAELKQAMETLGPEELTKEILMAGLPTDYAIKQLTALGTPLNTALQLVAKYALPGQTSSAVGPESTATTTTATQDLIKSLMNSLFPNQAAAGTNNTLLSELTNGITSLGGLLGFSS